MHPGIEDKTRSAPSLLEYSKLHEKILSTEKEIFKINKKKEHKSVEKKLVYLPQ